MNYWSKSEADIDALMESSSGRNVGTDVLHEVAGCRNAVRAKKLLLEPGNVANSRALSGKSGASGGYMIPHRGYWIFLVLSALALLTGCDKHQGIVVDSTSKRPIVGAILFHNGRMATSGTNGEFVLSRARPKEPVLIKAPGFERKQVFMEADTPGRIELEPFDAKGVYLSYYGVGSSTVRDRVIELISTTALNAVVIDIKAETGLLSFPADIPLAEQMGAMSHTTVSNAVALIEDLHSKKIYVIGRISTFKDNLFATNHPEWAIQSVQTKSPYAEKGDVAWMDPFRKEVWDYNIAIARAAAQVGFDEIQFDYVRFPVNTGPNRASYKDENNATNRTKAITGFLEKAYRELLPYNVYVAADTFGIACWSDEECGIGQSMRNMARWTDYLCPMVYPSGFGDTRLYTQKNAVEVPGKVILWSMQRALPLVGKQPKKLRPWLQNFKDYSFDGREFTEHEIALQISGSDKAKTSGWLLWNASNKYKFTAEALQIVETGRKTNVQTRTLTIQ